MRRLVSLVLAAALLGWSGSALAAGEEKIKPAFEGGLAHHIVTATAYTSGPESTGKRPGHPHFGRTFTGTPAREGRTIAVDPEKIPLGSKVYIEGYAQPLIAEDTGGSIRGDRIDLYMEDLSQARAWGVRKVRIHVTPKI